MTFLASPSARVSWSGGSPDAKVSTRSCMLESCPSGLVCAHKRWVILMKCSPTRTIFGSIMLTPSHQHSSTATLYYTLGTEGTCFLLDRVCSMAHQACQRLHHVVVGHPSRQQLPH